MTHSASLSIGEIDVRFETDDASVNLLARGYANGFATHHSNPNVRIRVRRAELPLEPPAGQRLFDAGDVWKLSLVGDRYVFSFFAPTSKPWAYKMASFDRGLCQGEILLDPRFAELHAFGYPLDELLFIHRLAAGEGVLLHACGLVDGAGDGLLFVGMSGAGKTTTARLWAAQPGVRILSDDRVIVRIIEGEPRIYGTPWHGEACFADGGYAPLRRVFLLRHAPENRVSTLSTVDALARLVSCSFMPFHQSMGLGFTMEFLEDIVARVPCHELAFVPDETAVLSARRHTNPSERTESP